ncbi:MAG TPA: efflux RND transporter permease subunit [Clostridiales bacterium]|nr:efflux RND transporter permease subunit [Clostridiales bacterium]HQP69509.1 efflux RND transporter permease subunit [Clostridiales bacterium]
MNLPKFSVENPVLVNMAMIIIIILGIFYTYRIPKESMPQIEWGMFMITVTYPGVAPDEIESLIIKEIEDELSDITDIDYITSVAYEGRAVVTLNLTTNADIDKAWADVSRELDKVKNLPEDASEPYMQNISIREMKSVCTIAVEGESYTPDGIKRIAENIKDDLAKINYVSKVELKGSKNREIRIEPDINKMEYFNISFSDIETAVRARNLNLPGGSIFAGNSEVLIRTMGEFLSVDQIEFVVLKAFDNGSVIRVRDIAAVTDTYEDINVKTRLNGKESINLYVYQNADGNILDIIENIKKYVVTVKDKYSNVNAKIINDESIEVNRNISTLSSSAVFGVILVFLTLLIFIGWRYAILAAWGIPFSFLMTFWLMHYFGITINNLSLFALVLVLGMVVDDAIVVIENVHRNIEIGMSPKDAAVAGTKEILWPIVAAVMTTIAAFLPLLMLEGNMGKFLSVFPIVVSIALFTSLFEAVLMLPSHLADFAKPHDKIKAESHFFKKVVKSYGRLLIGFLKRRTLVMSLLIIALIISLITVVRGYIKFEFFPKTAPATLTVKAETFSGAHLDQTDSLASRIEKYLMSLPYQENFQSLNTNIGQQQDRSFWDEGTNLMEFRLDLIDADSLTVDLNVVTGDIRKFLNGIPEIVSYKFFTGRSGPPTGEDVELRITGDDLKKLEELSENVKRTLSGIEGVTDIDDNFDSGKKELKIYPDYDKLAIYGISLSEIASFVRVSSVGKIISEYSERSEKYNIRVILPEHQFDTADKIENLKINTKTGKKVILKDVAKFEISNTISRISRRDGKRAITITASTGSYTSGGKTFMRTPDEANELLFGNKIKNISGALENFEKDHPGYKIEAGGAADERKKSFGSLYIAFLLAMIMIYMILGAQFKSYIQPLIVMITIPFAFIGVIIGLISTHTPFSILSMIAVVALAGIVVNDSIVMVDFINKERESGTDRWNSLINAGKTRLRPILLTTITTIFGLVPMIISSSESVKMWKPMAVSIVFGLGFATILTLLVLPVVYSFIDGFSCRCSGTQTMSFKDALNLREEKGYDK